MRQNAIAYKRVYGLNSSLHFGGICLCLCLCLRIVQSWMVFAELYIIIFQNKKMQNQNRIWKEPKPLNFGSWHHEWYVECYVLMCFHILEVDTMNGMWNAMYWCVFIFCSSDSNSGSWHYEWYVECYVLMCFHILLLWSKFNLDPSIILCRGVVWLCRIGVKRALFSCFIEPKLRDHAWCQRFVVLVTYDSRSSQLLVFQWCN